MIETQLTVVHDEQHVANCVDILERTAIQDDQIRLHARPDRARALGNPEAFRAFVVAA